MHYNYMNNTFGKGVEAFYTFSRVEAFNKTIRFVRGSRYLILFDS